MFENINFMVIAAFITENIFSVRIFDVIFVCARFRTHVNYIATVMFNCFAKNLVAKINSDIHKLMKRQGPVEEKEIRPI